MSTCSKHPEVEAVAVVVLMTGDSPVVGDFLCQSCAQCSEGGGCTKLGVVMDAEYQEPWCQAAADAFTGEEAVSGPAIVALDSDQARELGFSGM